MLKSFFGKRRTLDIAQTFQQAFGSHQQGDLPQAERMYRAVLEAQPDNFDALHLLGVVSLQQGRFDEAATLIVRALHRQPDSEQALSNLGLAYQGCKRNEEALATLDRAIALNPTSAAAHFNRANVLHALGRFDKALAAYDEAIARGVQAPAAYANRGNALQSLHRYEEALESYARALELQPDHAETLANRGVAYLAMNRIDEAVASCDMALAARPDYPLALNHRATALARQERYVEAIADYDRALLLDFNYAEALNNRGNALHALARDKDAVADYDSALAVAPEFIEVQVNRGVALQGLNRLDEAIAAYDRVLELRPDHANALHMKGIVLRALNRHDEALAATRALLLLDPDFPYALGDVAHSLAHLCDWREYRAMARRVEEDVKLGKNVAQPFVFLTLSNDAAAQLTCAAAYVDRGKSVATPWTGDPYRHDKIRIAYLSANYHDHPVAHLIAGLLEQHDRDRFELTGISFGPEIAGAMRSRLVASFDRFVDIRGKSDADTVRQMREWQIDIAVDLMGFTQDERTKILVHRPSPIQVNYLGYPGTMGADFIDYILADPFVIPASDQVHYAEKVVYLPDCYQVNDSKRKIAVRTPSRAEVGLPDSGFVFCCFNNNYKITPDVFDAWMRLLQRIDNSVLWLLRANASAERNLMREAQDRGIAPDRLIFAPRVGPEDHLARQRLADLFLDTLPYNAHTTASDALWAGLPVLTRSGDTFAGRVASSLLHAVGLPELVTYTLEDYEALAFELATKPARLRETRDKLARNRLTRALFDTDRFRRHIEAAYASMVEIHRRGERPRSFAVDCVSD